MEPKEEGKKETTISWSNPKEYFGKFRESGEYARRFQLFKSGKNFTEEYLGETRDEFEKMETARLALVEFSKNQGIVKYDHILYEKNNPISDYLRLLDDQKKHPDRFDDVVAYDKVRFGLHQDATRYIATKFNIPEKIAEGIVQLMAINKGLESYGVAEQDRIERIKTTI